MKKRNDEEGWWEVKKEIKKKIENKIYFESEIT